MLTSRRRQFLYEEIQEIAEEIKVYKISNAEINESMRRGISINELEAANFARLIDSLDGEPDKIFLDSPDVISERFGVRISMFSKRKLAVQGVAKRSPGIKVIAEHKADSRYPVVSCASIIAKTERDKEIERIGDEAGMEIGSGYPSDSYTIDAIRQSLGSKKLGPYLREYWSTMKSIRQLKMSDFG